MSEIDLGHWHLREGLTLPVDFEENPPLGFIYKVTDKVNNKWYIGQKKITKVEKRPPLKGKVRKRKIVKQTDWKTYTSSCNTLKFEILQRPKEEFDFEILHFVDCKWMLSYVELWYQMQMEAMFDSNSYNGIVNVRLSKFDSMKEAIKETWSNLKNGASEAWQGIKDTFAKIPTASFPTTDNTAFIKYLLLNF